MWIACVVEAYYIYSNYCTGYTANTEQLSPVENKKMIMYIEKILAESCTLLSTHELCWPMCVSRICKHPRSHVLIAPCCGRWCQFNTCSAALWLADSWSDISCYVNTHMQLPARLVCDWLEGKQEKDSLVPRPRTKRAWSHLQKFPYVLCQQSSFGVEESRLSILHSWHRKVVDSFQDQLKMGTRLAGFCKPWLSDT